VKLLTLLYLQRPGEVLLAMKKRGFGEGRWNGVGGKVELGETVRAAAIRECREEIGVTPLQPRLAGKLTFYDKADPDFCHHTVIYVTERWQGEPGETEEMRPQWFAIDQIPYGQMWPDDGFWLPVLLEGKRFEGTFTIDGNTVADDYRLREVSRVVAPDRPL
jgi:ADP-ribose pyrophosphatase YjhB (NUDIX family)